MTSPNDSYSVYVARLAGRLSSFLFLRLSSQNPNFPFLFSRKPVLQRV